MYEWSKEIVDKITSSNCLNKKELICTEIALRMYEIYDNIQNEAIGLGEGKYELQHTIRSKDQKESEENIMITENVRKQLVDCKKQKKPLSYVINYLMGIVEDRDNFVDIIVEELKKVGYPEADIVVTLYTDFIRKEELTLVNDACIGSGDVHMVNRKGEESPFVLESCEYYEADAVDASENEYKVYWDVKQDYDPEVMDEDQACDWDNPAYVLDVTKRKDVTDEVLIKR